MTKTEVKKALYIQKPVAKKIGFGGQKRVDLYGCELIDGTKVLFEIPYDESQELNNEEPAQLLIRWLV